MFSIADIKKIISNYLLFGLEIYVLNYENYELLKCFIGSISRTLPTLVKSPKMCCDLGNKPKTTIFWNAMDVFHKSECWKSWKNKKDGKSSNTATTDMWWYLIAKKIWAVNL